MTRHSSILFVLAVLTGRRRASRTVTHQSEVQIIMQQLDDLLARLKAALDRQAAKDAASAQTISDLTAAKEASDQAAADAEGKVVASLTPLVEQAEAQNPAPPPPPEEAPQDGEVQPAS